jgi:hypothetical protein
MKFSLVSILSLGALAHGISSLPNFRFSLTYIPLSAATITPAPAPTQTFTVPLPFPFTSHSVFNAEVIGSDSAGGHTTITFLISDGNFVTGAFLFPSKPSSPCNID